jgi:hypothetical protein
VLVLQLEIGRLLADLYRHGTSSPQVNVNPDALSLPPARSTTARPARPAARWPGRPPDGPGTGDG